MTDMGIFLFSEALNYFDKKVNMCKKKVFCILQVSAMIKAVLFNTFPPRFITAVKEFYTAAFMVYKKDKDISYNSGM